MLILPELATLDKETRERHYKHKVFGDAIQEVCRAKRVLEDLEEDVEELPDGASARTRHRLLAEVCSAWAELHSGLGALIALLDKRPDGDKVDDQTTDLMKKWQAACRDGNKVANESMKEDSQMATYEDAIPSGEGWMGSWPLGAGAYGRTLLYVRQNNRGRIDNRVVVKDCDYNLTRNGRELWDQLGWFWVTSHQNQEVPIEVQTMSDLRGRVGAEFVVKILNWRIARERRLYRLYLEV